jgi:TolA-binding protein
MAAQELNRAPSRRFIRLYLVLWGVAAIGALGYLGMLAWQPEQLAPAQPKVVEPDPGLRAATKALAEVGTVRQVVDTLQKDVGDLKGTVEQRSDQDRTMQSRLAALEERVAALPSGASMATPANLPATKQKAGEAKPAAEPKAADKAQPKAAGTIKPAPHKAGSPRVISIPDEPAGSTPADASKAPIETGSITQPEIVFGEAIVTKAEELYAVQLDAAPSLDILRMRWGVLVERYGATLATLQPRYVAPRTQGAPYRLLAGPLTSAGAARQVCSELRAQLPACSATDFIGDPL